MSEELFNEQIREIIKKIRKEQDLSQKDLADVLEVTRGFIGQVETGKSRLSAFQFQKVLNHYGYKAIFGEDGKVEVLRGL